MLEGKEREKRKESAKARFYVHNRNSFVRVLDPSRVRLDQISNQLIKVIKHAIRSDLKLIYHTITNHKNTKNDDLGKLLKLWFQSKKLRENLT